MASPQYNNYMQQAQQPLSRPNSQPAPTQPGFGTQSGATALTQPPASGFGQAGGLGALQQFNQQGSFGGFTPQFGGFGQNPQMQQYRQQLDAWRSQRPDMQPGMDRDAFRQQMDAYRDMRPDRPNMQQYGQGAPYALASMPAPGGTTPVAGQQAALQNAYQDFLAQKQFGSAIPAGGTPAQLTPQQIQSMQGALGLFAGAGGQPQVGTAAPQAAQGSQAFYSQAMNNAAALAGAQSPAPSQAVMPQAPMTQQITQEPPRMQAMRNMQRTKPGFGG